jgi:hypothetical protein
MTVGLPCRDAETTREDGTGQREDDEVAHGEVARSAHDATDASVVTSDIDLTPADGLLEVGEFFDGLNTPDDQGA